MANKIKVSVFKDDYINYLPDSPNEFLKFWTDKFDLIPEEFKESAYIEAEFETPYTESPCLNVNIGYYRQESEEEQSNRMNFSNEKLLKIEADERKKLAELKVKYE